MNVLEMMKKEDKKINEDFMKNIISEGKVTKNKAIDIFKDE